MNRNRLATQLGKPPRETLVVEEQTVTDIMRQITSKHKSCAGDYDKISSFFGGGTIRQICKRLYDFCQANLSYYEEPEDSQYVSSPQTMLKRGYADCKGYALFNGGVLDSLRRKGYDLDFSYRYVSYNLLRTSPGHVFIVVRDQDQEIWLDPVIKPFDYHKPYFHSVDRKTRVGAIGSCGCQSCNCGQQVGSTASTGATISTITTTVAPYLATIPVVGWAAIAVGELTGLGLQIFGYKWSTQWSVRWLVQLYQQYVLGQTGVTGSNANESLANTAISWFSTVLGVPVGDRTMFDMLKGTVNLTLDQINHSTRPSYDQRARDYLGHTGTEGVSYQAAYQAAQRSDTLDYNAPPGGWKGATAAPWLIDNSQQAAVVNTVTPGGPAASDDTMLWVIGGGAVALLLLTSKKKT